ncbi:MAG: radical SAM family heme chaperone HemW [Bdellovibrionaceae bacterium]|nr:radical SAM family heme chaperone HemW [Pseudobdellovibrionaceae bacterium]
MFTQTSNLSQGIYIHIPYCLQKCHYCDFATILLDEGPSMDIYCDYVISELSLKLLPQKSLSSIYFGGGTPSLFGTGRIKRILDAIQNQGYTFQDNIEITYEINPGTLTKPDLDLLKSYGVTRYSVGVQTFDSEILKKIGREHNAEQSRETLKLLYDTQTSFTADLILGLPQISADKFAQDVAELSTYNPSHISIYLLTVPELHFLNKEAPKDDQLEDLILQAEPLLHQYGFTRYEISNYVHKTGHPSKHNLLYWNDFSYWGVGLGAHSYFKEYGSWGTRFWNPRSYKSYFSQIDARLKTQSLPPAPQIEALQLHESMTDFSFTHLRQSAGIPRDRLESKFPAPCVQFLIDKLQKLQKEGYIFYETDCWKLTAYGKQFADRTFRELCFTKDEIKNLTRE